ncbi:sensor domain-containing diguanylate cyclase [Pseudoneobacillus sp. C159]
MQVKPNVKKAIWLSWSLIVPLGMWLVFTHYPLQISHSQLDDFLGFAVLALIGGLMPMVINNTPISLILWGYLAIFLAFGLAAELIVSQVALVALLIRLRVGKTDAFRYPLNSIMFFIISITSGLIYYSLGGATGMDLINNPSNFWFAVVYALVHFMVNQFLLTLTLRWIYERKRTFLAKDIVWDLATVVISLPIGFTLYILYRQVGEIAFLSVGVPFVTLSIILYLYYSSQKINEYLQNAADIGHQLAEHLQVDEVLDLFIQKVSEMLPVDYAYILDVKDERLELLRRMEKCMLTPPEIAPIMKNEGISGYVWASRKAVIFHSEKEWKKYAEGYMPPEAQSLICVPIVRHNEVTGILFLASKQKRAYEKSQLIIVDILCSHFAVAIENAKHYQETKAHSERCALTKLYNYRYFERLVAEEYEKLEIGQRQTLSLVILDIDHFKVINDTYGHQSGNEILYELANRVKSTVGNNGTVARFGGEEFVVLLPDMTKEDALEMAETIRQEIAYYPFILNEHIGEDEIQLSVHITASIGVASAPADADDSMALIRHADRALYVGAKRAGRNRVAEYVK